MSVAAIVNDVSKAYGTKAEEIRGRIAESELKEATNNHENSAEIPEENQSRYEELPSFSLKVCKTHFEEASKSAATMRKCIRVTLIVLLAGAAFGALAVAFYSAPLWVPFLIGAIVISCGVDAYRKARNPYYVAIQELAKQLIAKTIEHYQEITGKAVNPNSEQSKNYLDALITEYSKPEIVQAFSDRTLLCNFMSNDSLVQEVDQVVNQRVFAILRPQLQYSDVYSSCNAS